MDNSTFPKFPKIPRFNREVIVTEKLDGSNALIHVSDEGVVRAGSRTRWIAPHNDNYGFARWVDENKAKLVRLGPGHHYGEWWGHGIQRGYDLKEKRFSLFNVGKWADPAARPACCGVVPELWRGLMGDLNIAALCDDLRLRGSIAAPGFKRPEGIVIFHVAGGHLFKVLLENDAQPKGNKDE